MSKGEEALIVFCHRCGQVLTRQGALLFGPPDAKGLVEKLHVCWSCWPSVSREHLLPADDVTHAQPTHIAKVIQNAIAAHTPLGEGGTWRKAIAVYKALRDGGYLSTEAYLAADGASQEGD